MNNNSAISGNISDASFAISGELSNRSQQIDYVDYELVRQYIQDYIANLSYVKDIDIRDDGSVYLITSDNI